MASVQLCIVERDRCAIALRSEHVLVSRTVEHTASVVRIHVLYNCERKEEAANYRVGFIMYAHMQAAQTCRVCAFSLCPNLCDR